MASGGRQGVDPAPGGEATAELVNRVLATAFGYVELRDTVREPIPETTVIPALWRDAATRRDVLVLAEGHLASLERQGSDPARAQARRWLEIALRQPPPMTG